MAFAWEVWLASLSVVQAETPRPIRPLVWLGVALHQSRDERVAAAQWLREVTTPMLLEVALQPNAATLRWVLPQALLQGVVDVFRQHIVQTLRQSLLGY
jgi:hypothetical protein